MNPLLNMLEGMIDATNRLHPNDPNESHREAADRALIELTDTELADAHEHATYLRDMLRYLAGELDDRLNERE